MRKLIAAAVAIVLPIWAAFAYLLVGANSVVPFGYYNISSAGNSIDNGNVCNGGAPAAGATNTGLGQQLRWDGARLAALLVTNGDARLCATPPTGAFLIDNGNGTVGVSATGSTWTLATSGGGATIRSNLGNYLSVVTGSLVMSATQTVWTFTILPTPTAIAFSPVSPVSLAVGTTAGTLITSATTTMSDASAFWASMFSTNTDLFCFSGTSAGAVSITLCRTIVTADVGTHPTTISSFSGGTTKTAALTLTVPSAGGVPPGAQAAGFTTNILHADFTSPAYATASTWLDCAGASSPKWWADSAGAPAWTCPYMATDAGTQVLQMVITSAQQVTDNGLEINMNSAPLGNCGAGVCIPAVTFYSEGLIRAFGFSPGAFMNAPWAAGGFAGCTMEFDSFETFGPSEFSDGGFHWCGQTSKAIWASGTLPNPPPGFDFQQYHRYAIRVTTDGSTIAYQCNYVDDLPQGCISLTPGQDGVTQAMITNPQFIAMVGSISSNINSGTQTQSFFENLERIDVWSCANWQSSTSVGGCATTNPNP